MADSVPHWGDFPSHRFYLKIAVLDGLVGLGVAAALVKTAAPEHRVKVAAGIAGAGAPDMNKPCVLFFGASPYPEFVENFHHRVQRETWGRWPQEILVAAAQGAAAWAWLGPKR